MYIFYAVNISFKLLLQHKTIELHKPVAGILPGLLYEIRRLLLLLFCNEDSPFMKF
jgi:hypothetical protein